MNNQPISGAFASRTPRRGYQLRQIIKQATASAEAVDIILEHALGQQSERPLTSPIMPTWAAKAMETPRHG